MAKYTSVYTGTQVDAAVRESLITGYGTCGTTASTVNKTVSVDSNFILASGAKVFVKFTYENTASNPTLQVNSTTSAPIKKYGTTNLTSSWNAGAVVGFIYDGTNWIILSDSSRLTVTDGILELG